MKLNENECIGLIKEAKGNSRFIVKIAEGNELLCFLRKKVKSNFKRSKNRMNTNDFVVLHIEPGFTVGNIIKKISDESEITNLKQKNNLSLYELE